MDRLTRVRYYAGQLLTAQDFQVEQDYVRAKRRIHNRLLLGAGVVSELGVTIDTASSDNAPVVSVEPGFAIAPDGEELVVPQRLTCTLSALASSSVGFVTLRFVERPVEPVPAGGTTGESQASRIEEDVALDFDGAIRNDGVPIARLARSTAGWQIDPDFRPAMIECASARRRA